MKTLLSLCAILILLALDWAALHDIVEGEPDTTLEYGMLILSVIICAAFLLYPYSKVRYIRRKYLKLPICIGYVNFMDKDD